MAWIRNRNTRITRAVFTVTPSQLFSKVHGITMRTTITARKHFPTLLERISNQLSRRFNLCDVVVITQKFLQNVCRFGQFTSN
ncbi:Uncharacterised protein [Vibrio cholerae]|nr:Uncharacterised protein [Vibrio cholerae]CSC64737.1 Uncharacterised protein [Vibrio cholerae]